jgi:hypothetical protein
VILHFAENKQEVNICNMTLHAAEHTVLSYEPQAAISVLLFSVLVYLVNDINIIKFKFNFPYF